VTDELNVLAGAYALDALDDAERARFEEHLAGCERCAEEVRGLRQATAELSRVSEAEPPAQLRAGVLAGIAQVRPLPPVVDSALADNVVALRRARVARSTWQLVAAACALVAIVVAGWGYSQHRDAARARSAQQSVVASLLAQPGVRAVTTSLSQGSGTVVYSPGEHRIVLLGRDLPALPADKTYQLWMLPDTGPAISGGTFRTDGAGNVDYQVHGDLTGVSRMGISVEPAGGSAQPTPSTVQLIGI